jgi:Fe2+ transport system protein FeoA
LDNGAASDDALSLLRLGLFPGETVEVVAHLPAGPTVVRQQHMELALGQQLAERILVQRVAS